MIFIYLSIYSFTYFFILFIYLFTYLSIYLFIYLFILIDKNLITYQRSKCNDNVETLVVNQNMRLNLFRSVFHTYGF